MIDAAIELFSAKGYEATSVADIQLACGLTAGSGALYKHFPSKRALLEEVLHSHLSEVEAIRDVLAPEMLSGLDPSAVSLEAMLRFGTQVVWQSMERNRAVVRITFRDLEPYPDLLDELWSGVFDDVYRQAAQMIELVLQSGTIAVVDPEATAAVLLASLTYFPILQGLIGRTPGDVDAQRTSTPGSITRWRRLKPRLRGDHHSTGSCADAPRSRSERVSPTAGSGPGWSRSGPRCRTHASRVLRRSFWDAAASSSAPRAVDLVGSRTERFSELLGPLDALAAGSTGRAGQRWPAADPAFEGSTRRHSGTRVR